MPCELRAGMVMTSGDVPALIFVGNKYISSTITSVQGTTPQVIFTGAPGYVITELGMQIDDISTIAVAGMITTKFADSSFLCTICSNY